MKTRNKAVTCLSLPEPLCFTLKSNKTRKGAHWINHQGDNPLMSRRELPAPAPPKVTAQILRVCSAQLARFYLFFRHPRPANSTDDLFQPYRCLDHLSIPPSHPPRYHTGAHLLTAPSHCSSFASAPTPPPHSLLHKQLTFLSLKNRAGVGGSLVL